MGRAGTDEQVEGLDPLALARGVPFKRKESSICTVARPNVLECLTDHFEAARRLVSAIRFRGVSVQTGGSFPTEIILVTLASRRFGGE